MAKTKTDQTEVAVDAPVEGMPETSIEPGADVATDAPLTPTGEALAQAEAEAKAAAEAAALADAEPAPALHLPTLSYLERQITLLNTEGTRPALMEELLQHYGLTGRVDEDTGDVALSMQGVTIDPAPDAKTALDNWGAAARRAIMQAVA